VGRERKETMASIRVKRLDGPAKKKNKKKKKKDKKNKKQAGKKAAARKQTSAPVKPTKKVAAPPATREASIARVHDRLERVINFENCPKDYESLKFDAKYLAGLTGYSFAVMAQRLAAIRDGKLYEEDGYADFRSFVDAELGLALRTVYDYLNVFDEFGALIISSGATDISYSKLLPGVALLKSANLPVRRDRVRNRVWEIARTMSKAEAAAAVRALRKRYGLEDTRASSRPSGSVLAREIEELKTLVPDRPDQRERALLVELDKYIRKVLGNI
jgi:hypothetical protein